MSEFNRIVWLTMLLMASAFTGHAQSKKAATSVADVTVITSDKLTFDYLKQYAFFEQNVVVVDPQMKIYADTMMVTFDENNRARNIKAQGNVIIIQEDKRARATMAEYNVETGEITLTGKPMITSGKNIFTADVIRYWRDDERMEGKPNSRLIIYPEGDAAMDSLFGEPARGR
ncbi:MAG TPA: LptA/OstA family protein [Kiritimatiellia bacterium]|nr:LptA/OstA family protein [Kiritimatiellia bacterium]